MEGSTDWVSSSRRTLGGYLPVADDRPGWPGGMRRLTLVAPDGVELSAVALPGPDDADTAIVLAHGFSGSWSQDRVSRIAGRWSRSCAVIAVDQRGHGRSAGRTTLGHREPLDVEAAARWARRRGYSRVVTAGFSMGGSVVLRHSALLTRAAGHAGVDAVVSVSAPAFWYYRGTVPMRWLHRAVGTVTGRAYLTLARGTRVDPRPWPDPVPMTPVEAATATRAHGIPLLIVHGDADPFFPLDHPNALHHASPGSHMWIEPGFGHAEGSASPELVDRIGDWILRESR